MEESIRTCFGLDCKDVRSYSPLTLAYIGDGVYELVIRTVVVVKGNRPPKQLHRTSSELVKAQTQAQMIEILKPILTEEEAAVYRRGRNANPSSMAKHASMNEYRKATGFEALMGYLYLSGQEERICELVKLGLEGLKADET